MFVIVSTVWTPASALCVALVIQAVVFIEIRGSRVCSGIAMVPCILGY